MACAYTRRTPGTARLARPTSPCPSPAAPGSIAAAGGCGVCAAAGAEALSEHMGHCGGPPIRRAWLLVVFPACILNYLGQGALILGHPASTSNPFFLLAPGWARLPMVFLATMATVIASQAVI